MGYIYDDYPEERPTEGEFDKFTPEKPDVEGALALLFSDSQVDGGHHKAWVLDQVTRALTGSNYEAFVEYYCFGDDEDKANALEEAIQTHAEFYGVPLEVARTEVTPEDLEASYEWDEGIAP